jgi:Protein of unknown function (DUF3102)/DNA N-6-adenine-methyltransferase (Dam)
MAKIIRLQPDHFMKAAVSLPPPSAISEINSLHQEILGAARTSLESAIRVGELLVQQKATLKHGDWLPWLEANIQFSRYTAANYMRVYDRREELKCVTITHLTDVYRLLAGGEPESESDKEVVGTGDPSPKPTEFQQPLHFEGEDELTDEQIEAAAQEGQQQLAEQEAVDAGEEGNKAHVSNNSGENEWYTPTEYIELARAVMGQIDLDPASCDAANEVIGAALHWTKDDDGLTKPWKGRVWMNPPYAQPLIAQFCEKLTLHYIAGDVSEAIVLINNASETQWFQKLAQVAVGMCQPAGRIKFWHPDRISAPLQRQTFLYLGSNGSKFCEMFSGQGIAWLRYFATAAIRYGTIP